MLCIAYWYPALPWGWKSKFGLISGTECVGFVAKLPSWPLSEDNFKVELHYWAQFICIANSVEPWWTRGKFKLSIFLLVQQNIPVDKYISSLNLPLNLRTFWMWLPCRRRKKSVVLPRIRQDKILLTGPGPGWGLPTKPQSRPRQGSLSPPGEKPSPYWEKKKFGHHHTRYSQLSRGETPIYYLYFISYISY